jgi:hypothetical protein
MRDSRYSSVWLPVSTSFFLMSDIAFAENLLISLNFDWHRTKIALCSVSAPYLERSTWNIYVYHALSVKSYALRDKCTKLTLRLPLRTCIIYSGQWSPKHTRRLPSSLFRLIIKHTFLPSVCSGPVPMHTLPSMMALASLRIPLHWSWSCYFGPNF